MLIQEKVAQAVGVLKEQGIDCWITFARESVINGDPILDLLIGSEVTWHTAVIITAAGEACTICGEYDRRTIEDTGAYRQVIGFVKGIREPFLEVMGRIKPSSIAISRYSPKPLPSKRLPASIASPICFCLTRVIDEDITLQPPL